MSETNAERRLRELSEGGAYDDYGVRVVLTDAGPVGGDEMSDVYTCSTCGRVDSDPQECRRCSEVKKPQEPPR